MKKYIIGIDLGGTNTRIALVSENGRIIKRHQFSTKLYKNKDDLINAIADAVSRLIGESRLKKAQIMGIGIGAPGLVDSKKGIVHCLTNVPGWKNVNLKSLLERKTGIKTCIDNDVNLMAFAESKFGAAKGFNYVFCVTLGTGVGGGIVIGGRIYRGASQSAGEIGHVSINPNGPRCKCGSKGCLEAYIGNNAVVKMAKDMNKAYFTPQSITDAAKKGDYAAKQIWSNVAGFLSVGLAMVINVLNPDIIVIGGGMAGAGKFLFDPLRKNIQKNAMEVPAKAVKIVAAKLGNDAGIIGAAELVRVYNKVGPK